MELKDLKVFEKSEKERIYELMQKTEPTTAEYKKLLEAYKELCEIEKKGKVSKDALLQVFANLAGIVLILKHEELNVISTKAINFVLKGRL